MSWSEFADPGLQAYITELQSTALSTYEINHDLLIEHVRQEDSFRTGGYGTRQIPELLQNAVDALGADGGTGTIEFRLADGALYCANEGQPFDTSGIRAVAYAFLSEKRGEEIGRFGLGFKSVLGVSDQPQVYSRSASFAFNAPQTAELFSGVPSAGGRYPLLRVPSAVDADVARREDPHLDEMMKWATTIVKLPLLREGARLRRELNDFTAETLLFLKPLERLRITLQGAQGAIAESRDFTRRGSPTDGDVVIVQPDGSESRWLYAEREYRPTEEVAATLQETALRESMTVAYAVRPDEHATIGRLWAWFPLADQTTARGIFNAPWQVNDDRTSLIAGSLLNGAMLEVAAELFLDVVTRASTPDDPAAHLDLFPGRGREVRSNADRMLTDGIPFFARKRAVIPDVTGELKVPEYFERVPDLERTPLTAGAARIWQERAPRHTMPHASCFATATRRSRVRKLLGGGEGARSAYETDLASWLEEIITDSDPSSTLDAIAIARALRESGSATQEAALSAAAVPLTGGGRARLSQGRTVLLPTPGAVAPDGVRTVRADVADVASDELHQFGFRRVSPDDTASALARSATNAWGESDWERLWIALRFASPAVAERELVALRERDVPILIRTERGDWRHANELITDRSVASDVPSRQVDAELVPNAALRKAAGTITEPASGRPIWRDALREEYVSAIEDVVTRYLAQGGHKARSVVVPEVRGVGPLDMFTEDLSDADRVAWTERVLTQMPTRESVLDVPLTTGQTAEVQVSSMEWWAARNYGLVRTSRGLARPTEAVARSLSRFAALLPVVLSDAAYSLPLPKDLRTVPSHMLAAFLEIDDPRVHEDAIVGELLTECAIRDDIAAPEKIPAFVNGQLTRTPRREVAVISDDASANDLREAGVAYVRVDDSGTTLIDSWGLLTAEDALQQSIEVVGADEAVPLLDIHPSLQQHVHAPLGRVTVARAASIRRVLHSVAGTKKLRRRSTVHDSAVVVDSSLDVEATLAEVSSVLELGLTPSDVRAILRADQELRHSELISRARSARNDEDRLLVLVGADTLRSSLPNGLLEAVESSAGVHEDRKVAELFLRVYGNDSVWELRDRLRSRGITVPDRWDGSEAAQTTVKNLGFDTAYAGMRETRSPAVTNVPGQITLSPLHDYQQEVASKIEELVDAEDPAAMRGLLYLPTGAGKTRVTVEALLTLMKSNKVTSPVLWIAQSEELCEQAIHSFAEVWRWIGDERSLDISRFWSGYELDESTEELQVVVAIDATLASRLGEPQYEWLTTPGIVVIDEAHTALSKSYSQILRHLGLTASQTARPLLGLTATPFRGRNDEINRLFAQRFGENRLEPLDPEDPIGQLRDRGALSEVDYALLDGSSIGRSQQDAEFHKMKEVTAGMLATIGQDMQRTLKVVDHIKQQPSNWPILVFAASVASAHTIAALLRLDGVRADSVDGAMRKQHRRRVIEQFKSGETQVLVNCDLLTQGFDAPKVRALYIARPTFSPNRYLQMVGRGLRGPENNGTERCLIVNVRDTFEEFGHDLAYNEFDYLWSKA